MSKSHDRGTCEQRANGRDRIGLVPIQDEGHTGRWPDLGCGRDENMLSARGERPRQSEHSRRLSACADQRNAGRRSNPKGGQQ
jgi:hypothetical protein